MAFKNTKVTEHCFTGSKFKNLVLASGIVKPSAASKNILQNKFVNNNQLVGFVAEKKVIDTMLNSGWELVFQRAKTKISEIDLIFEKPRKICLVEVKKLDNEWRSFQRISDNQLKNLRLNRIYFSRSFNEYEVMSYVCFVKDKKTYFTEIN